MSEFLSIMINIIKQVPVEKGNYNSRIIPALVQISYNNIKRLILSKATDSNVWRNL
jgi:hypothetical protein